MSPTLRRVYWAIATTGIVSLTVGGGVGVSVFTLINQHAETAPSEDIAVMLQFMSRTTIAVVAIFLGSVILAACAVLAILRRWVMAFGRRLLATINVRMRRFDAMIATHEELDEARFYDIMKILTGSAEGAPLVTQKERAERERDAAFALLTEQNRQELVDVVTETVGSMRTELREELSQILIHGIHPPENVTLLQRRRET